MGRDPASIAICAVTKSVGVDEVREAARAGLRIFGENRVQEAERKIPLLEELTGLATWRLIGHLQRNKAARARELFDAIDSVDSLALAERLGGLAARAGTRIRVLVEVKTSEEAAKSGIPGRGRSRRSPESGRFRASRWKDS